MKIRYTFVFYLLFFTIIPFHTFSQTKAPLSNIIPEQGVSENLAVYRKSILSNLSYDLQFSIPSGKDVPIDAEEIIFFNWNVNQSPLPLDFKEKKDHLIQLIVNDKQIPISFEQEHILIDPQYLKQGYNKARIKFIAGDLSLNRNDDYLYTLLVPDRARTVFPCFDQPDLKATFQLTLTIPKDWKAVSNAPLKDSINKGSVKIYHYQTSNKISTYLFSFVAGKFNSVKRIAGIPMTFYYRETDTSKIKHSLDPIFKIHQNALFFLQEYTQILFPFKKFDFLAIPDFQYGGMEHVGAIQYKASTMFLDEGATKDEEISRSNLLSHETSHMWFGDLVTMKWFNDVWMKEVFANFMADKITQVALPGTNYDLKFLLDHYPAAYSVDRTAGANPIRQSLNNLQDAGSLYGNIIYHKAPIMMRQLELLMGKVSFRNGLREYLKKYAFANASWPELISILDRYTPIDLESWNRVWVNESGRPQFGYTIKFNNNRISELIVKQKGEDGSDRIWPQTFKLAFIYPDTVREVTVKMNNSAESIKAAIGNTKPDFILFNSSGEGYGLFPIDTAMLDNQIMLKNPVMRASGYINLYENMLSGRLITPLELLVLYKKNLEKEPEELNLRLITGQINDIFWKYISPESRQQIVNELEKELWIAMNKAESANCKKILFKTYQSIALSKESQDRLYSIWQKQQAPEGVKLSEEDYTALALSLAVRDCKDTSVLNIQMQRIKNVDRQKRLKFLIPALSSDVKVRDAFFASLKDEKNREKEAWVVTALQYLHHPLRATTSQKYLKESLDLLQEIQLTGDIFFPQSWLQSIFGSYQSREAADVVQAFLNDHPDYNPMLKAKIQQATDGIFRAQKLINSDHRS
jgi:aminopeptidase N